MPNADKKHITYCNWCGGLRHCLTTGVCIECSTDAHYLDLQAHNARVDSWNSTHKPPRIRGRHIAKPDSGDIL